MKVRNPITGIILSIVTCGLYGIYWMYCMATEIAKFKDENESGLIDALLMILLPFVGFFLSEKKLAAACAEKGIEHKDNSILYLILCFLGPLAWANYYLMQSDLNKLAE
jgi:hypothetical protein